MARGQTSRAEFVIEIKGEKSGKEILNIIKQLKKESEDLQVVLNKIEGKKGSSSKSGTSGRHKASERIAGMELKVIRGEIDSVQQLSAEYGSLVNQLDALERKGKAVNSMRVRAEKQHQKLRAIIDARVQANVKLSESEEEVTRSYHAWDAAIEQVTADQIQLAHVNDLTTQSITRVGASTRQTAFFMQNFGFLIQDLPFTLMSGNLAAIANNFPGVGQSFQMVSDDVGGTKNAIKALIGQIRTPTGLLFLLGSALPSAILIGQFAWKKYKEHVGEVEEETDNYLSTLEDLISKQSELENIFGADPFGVLEAEEMSAELSKIAMSAFDYTEAINELDIDKWNALWDPDLLGTALRTASPLFGIITDFFIDSKKYSRDLENLEDKFKGISNIPVDDITEKLKELKKEMEFQEFLRGKSPILEFQHQWSRTVDNMIADYDLFTDKVFSDRPEIAQAHRKAIETRISAFENIILNDSNRGVKRLAKDYVDKLRSAIEEESKKKNKEETDILTAGSGFDDIVGDALKLEMAIFQQREDEATNFSARLEAIEEQRRIAEQQLAMEGIQEIDKLRLREFELEQEYSNKIKALITERTLHELEMDNMLLESGIHSESSYNKKLEMIDEFYDRREQIILASNIRVEEMFRLLWQNEEDRRNDALTEEEKYENAKQQLISQSAEFAVTSIQSIALANAETNKAQWEINKYAAAGKAAIDAWGAFNATLNNPGGYFNAPLAGLALASGLANVAKILATKYGDRSAGRGGGGGSSMLTSYRGFNVSEDFTDRFNSENQVPFFGSSNVSPDAPDTNNMFPKSVKAQFTDGFGKVVSQGTLELQSKEKSNFGYWS